MSDQDIDAIFAREFAATATALAASTGVSVQSVQMRWLAANEDGPHGAQQFWVERKEAEINEDEKEQDEQELKQLLARSQHDEEEELAIAVCKAKKQSSRHTSPLASPIVKRTASALKKALPSSPLGRRPGARSARASPSRAAPQHLSLIHI